MPDGVDAVKDKSDISQAAVARIAHQTSIMCLKSLMEQFAERIHPNQLKDIRFAIDANETALKETP